jgi:hypothetical protein
MITEEQIIELYKATNSVRATAAALDISYTTVRKVLVSNGQFSSPHMDEVVRMQESGLSPQEIADALGVKRAAVMSFLPYTRGGMLLEKSLRMLKR